jgi:catechol 2,3-dioxygenase-like lactoylglutathione lyase family enzyme
MDVVALLVERGARHHVFSALAVGDAGLVSAIVEQNPAALDRRMGPGEHRQTPLHFAISRGRADMLDVLIALGADVDATDANGQTPLEFAMLRGDHPAATRLRAAGATPLRPAAAPRPARGAVGQSVRELTPILLVPDVAATLRWYTSLGFHEVGRYPADGTAVYWGMVSLGSASIMFEPGTPDGGGVMLLFATDNIRDQYESFTSRQLAATDDAKNGRHSVEFVDNLHEPVFGGLRFSIRDCNGFTLQFLQGAQS